MTGVLETVLYVSDLDRAERFYAQVLGLRLVGKEPGRSLFFRAGSSVFLLFNPAITGGQDDSFPHHGATGSGHSCFVVPEDQYDRWRMHLVSRGVTILKDIQWERGKSFYFRLLPRPGR